MEGSLIEAMIPIRESWRRKSDLSFLTKVDSEQGSKNVLSRARIRLINRIWDGLLVRTH